MAVHEDRERFIPYRKAEIVDLLCKDGQLSEEQQQQFRSFCKILESLYHFEFHEKMEELKNNYFPFNPDKDTKTQREYSNAELQECEKRLVDGFRDVLDNANYEQITSEDLQHAVDEESLFKISLYVDFEDFADQLIYWRGETINKVTVRKMLFKKEEFEVPTLERVAMLIKFKDEEYFKSQKRKNIMFEPGSMILKLFKNIPRADLEMLFPNTQVKMKLKDKMALGVPTFAGGAAILFTKGTAILAAIPALYILSKTLFGKAKLEDISSQDMALLIGAGAALGAILGYGLRQWGKYKNRKMEFMKTLSDNLYFKNLDNNGGVFHYLIDSAEEEECKEAILGYYFLMASGESMDEETLDNRIEKWFENQLNTHIDFEVDDAVNKLKNLGLCNIEDRDGKHIYSALTLDQACEKLDYVWDNYFQYNE